MKERKTYEIPLKIIGQPTFDVVTDQYQSWGDDIFL